MIYRELIQFNPIESIIQLHDANDKKKAAELVKSYVMSDDMADKLNLNMLSQLRLVDAVDSKGVLLVGNYGTGKSHLMSVISAVAFDESYLGILQNRKFSKHAKCIGGKFEVLRIEIGSSQMPLRDIILSKVKEEFKVRGISFEYPDAAEIVNNKETLKQMMALFAGKYDKGFLIAVDEFLDYLRGRKEQEVMRDLGFLRELGEFVKASKLRVIFGVQEKLFDNPNFAFVSQTLSRIKDRFEQVTIQKGDTQYVVSQRILQKTPEQKAKIRKHLQKFCSLYSNMSERIEEYVELFPIHPSYIDVFNKIIFIETRHILKNISEMIRRRLDETVNDQTPGIISFDSYWAFIKENLALSKTDANIRDVVEKSGNLEDIITRSFPKKAYKGIAIQIIHALSVHRLSTNGDTSIRAGLTSENLRDDLCLFIQGLPDQSSDTLQSVIQATLKDMMTTVSGQFIDCDRDNGQYFLDLKKDVDYDEKISQRAAMIDDDKLNAYYHKVIFDCMDWNQREHVTNFQIYQHQLQWQSHNIHRRGYLFLGTPEGRPTAQPPEDYYVYFIPPYGNEAYDDKKKDDEVFFIFRADNEEFKNNLRLYAAAQLQREMADEKNKTAYATKADIYKKRLLQYLSANKNTCFDVIYKGVRMRLIELLKGKYSAITPFKDTIDITASVCLDAYFSAKYPEFPKFKIAITERNQADCVQAAFNRFAGRKTQQADAMLESLGLIDGDNISIKTSQYAGYYIQFLDKLPAGNVLNFSDIYEESADGYFRDKKFKLSFALLPIALLGMVYAGHAIIKLKDGTELTASNMDMIPKLGTMGILEFQYIAKPRSVAVNDLIRLFEILGLPAGLVRNPSEREKGVERLLATAQRLAEDASTAAYKLSTSFELWGELVVPSNIAEEYKVAAKFVGDMLGNFQSRFNTVAKLNNFAYTAADLDKLEKGLAIINIVGELDVLHREAGAGTTYLSNLEYIDLGEAIKAQIEQAKAEFRRIRDGIRTSGTKGEAAAHEINEYIKKVKKSYIDKYFTEHQSKRLDVSASKRKGDLISSLGLANLKRLKTITILSISKLDVIERDLASLKTCFDLTSASLDKTHLCKCGFQIDGGDLLVRGRLEEIENRVDVLTEEWTKTLFNTINDPLVIGNKKFLSAEQQKIVDAFIKNKTLPERIDSTFTDAITKLLQGFEPVAVSAAEIIDKLDALGPCDIDTLKREFNVTIDGATRGKDKDKLRIIIKK